MQCDETQGQLELLTVARIAKLTSTEEPRSPDSDMVKRQVVLRRNLSSCPWREQDKLVKMKVIDASKIVKILQHTRNRDFVTEWRWRCSNAMLAFFSDR